MNNPPFFSEIINSHESVISPSTVHISNSVVARYFKKYLLQRVMSVFTVTAPDYWPINYWLYSLFGDGICSVIKTSDYGVIPQWCTLSGYDVFYRPKRVLIANPLINNGRGTEYVIGKECVLFYLNPDYTGIGDIVDYYGNLLALCAESTSINLLNTRLAYLLAADDKAIAESLKKMYDKVSSGEPAVVFRKNMLNEDGSLGVQLFEQNLASNFIAPKVLETMNSIRQMFDTEVGIPNANITKRERQITDEVNANNAETQTRMAMCLDTLKKCCGEAKKMFGIELDFDWRYRQQEVDSSAGDLINPRNV